VIGGFQKLDDDGYAGAIKTPGLTPRPPAPDAMATRDCAICGAATPEAGSAFCSFCEGWDGVPEMCHFGGR
jgi:hypothetical protein